MRTFTSETQFPYPWAQTAIGLYHKYPNPQASHVISMDTVHQQFDVETGQLRLERVLGVRQSAPRWVVKLLNLAEDTYVREVTLFDPASSIVKMTSTNMTLSEYLLCKEYITYSSTTPDSTTFRQKATIESSLGGGAEAKGILAKAARKLEESSHERFGLNAAKGREGMLTVLRSLWGQSAADQGAKM